MGLVALKELFDQVAEQEEAERAREVIRAVKAPPFRVGDRVRRTSLELEVRPVDQGKPGTIQSIHRGYSEEFTVLWDAYKGCAYRGYQRDHLEHA